MGNKSHNLTFHNYLKQCPSLNECPFLESRNLNECSSAHSDNYGTFLASTCCTIPVKLDTLLQFYSDIMWTATESSLV